MKQIGVIGAALAPYFNEAMANQIHILSEKLNAQVITCNDIGLLPFKLKKQYFIVNTRYLMRRMPIISFINGVILYVVIKLYERKFEVIIIPGGINSEFLRYLKHEKCVPIITSIPSLDVQTYLNIKTQSAKFIKIITNSRKTKKQLLEIGVNPEKIIFYYPLIELDKFRHSGPPLFNEFRILFASSPNLEVDGEDNFRDKGVLLLLTAFKEYLKYDITSKLYIVWRGCYNERLYKEIDSLKIKNHVNVIDCLVDMPQMYAQTHVTVIPFLNLWRSPEIPSSALESLFSGRPLIATDVGEISDIVKKYDCGVSIPAKERDLCCAMKMIKAHYLYYQKNTLNFHREYINMTKCSWGGLFDEQQ